MIYYLNDVRTIYQDKANKKFFINKDNNRMKIDINIPIDNAEELFSRYKIYFALGDVKTLYHLKINKTIINIYKHKDDILKQ